jgi:hypothetical protein
MALYIHTFFCHIFFLDFYLINGFLFPFEEILIYVNHQMNIFFLKLFLFKKDYNKIIGIIFFWCRLNENNYFCLYINNFGINNIQQIFYKCSSLTYFNISYFNNENLINFSFMLSDCFSLKKINISILNTLNERVY